MTGCILLEGGAEFGGQMAAPDRRAIELAGGFDARISIIPTAAAPDRNHERAGGNGRRWFESLGARNVEVLPLLDRVAAERRDIADALSASRLIYLLGGFTRYLGQTLKDSAAWQAMLDAYREGAVVAGSSAGAMVLCQHYYDPESGQVVEGLGLVPNACVLPHHNTFGRGWASRLTTRLPGTVLLGLDEQTGMIDDGENGQWMVYGGGEVTLYRGGRAEAYRPGERLAL